MSEKLKPVQCEFCPLRGEQATCVVLRTGHIRICDWVNPNSPHFKPSSEPYVASLAMKSGVVHTDTPGFHSQWRGPANLSPPGWKPPKPGNDDPFNPPGIGEKPENPNPFTPEPTQPGKPLALISDENTHALVYEGARDCSHKRQDVSCCGPITRCGNEGERPGMLVTIRDCYPCTATRLGVEVK
jgi:hypothetical protein